MKLSTIHKTGSLAVLTLAMSFCIFVWAVYFTENKMPLLYICAGSFVIGVILFILHLWAWFGYIEKHSVWPGDGLS